MGSIKKDFAAASREQRIKYCRFYIEEASAAGKSKKKIYDELARIGADEEVLDEAFYQIKEEIPSEMEKAESVAEKLIRQANNTLSSSVLRKILYKLAYMGYEEEIISEIAEKLRFEYGLEDIFS
ncbi:MAG: RecX family transcriptional regulator [Firmicutes bacterium]|nr:RecX family transcriptional regulator [Bacillota bacterium]